MLSPLAADSHLAYIAAVFGQQLLDRRMADVLK